MKFLLEDLLPFDVLSLQDFSAKKSKSVLEKLVVASNAVGSEEDLVIDSQLAVDKDVG